MINAVALDVDGVIVGNQEGINFPYPNQAVSRYLKSIRESGIYVILCTGKSGFSVEKIIKDANLDNPHIAFGGSLGFNPIRGLKMFEQTLDSQKILDFVAFYKKRDFYLELYTDSDYFVFQDQVNDKITPVRIKILQRKPVIIQDLTVKKAQNLLKINLVAVDEKGVEIIRRTFSDNFMSDFDLRFSIQPKTTSWQYGVVTPRGVSKGDGFEKVVKLLKIESKDVLGIGDTMHDWDFMKLCGYGATLSDGSNELKDLIFQKKEKGFIGGCMNEDGVVDILRYFGLI